MIPEGTQLFEFHIEIVAPLWVWVLAAIVIILLLIWAASK
jgi:hypothetical protein